MRKLIYLASLICVTCPLHAQPIIPGAFTILDAQTLPDKGDLLRQEKKDCIFVILLSTSLPSKGDIKKPHFYLDNYRTFFGLKSEFTPPLIPQNFIKASTPTRPGVPTAPTRPTFHIHFGWTDRGGKNNITDAAHGFAKSLAQLHRSFKKSYNCYYIVITEGRSGLLLNYATQHPLKQEAFTIDVALQIGTPLPSDMEKAHRDFYPNLSRIGTLYAFYSQHAYLTSNSYFPPSPRTGYPETFVNTHNNVYNIRLLLNNNQQSLQNIFEKRDIKKSYLFFGHNVFKLCNFIKQSYQEHHDLWVSLDTRNEKRSRTFMGIITHPAGEKDSKKVRQEHQRAGIQREAFQKLVGSANRIEMNSGHRMRSSTRSIAHFRKSDRATLHAA